MTREETIKILAILKAAYPNSYKDMTKAEANGTIAVWAAQFASYPADLVAVAVNKLISSAKFPPAISEVKEKISGMYWEVWEVLNQDRHMHTLTDDQRARYQAMMDAIEPLRINPKCEPSLVELIGNGNQKLLT